MLIEPDGRVVFIHDDALAGGLEGERQTARASHVEPVPGGQWAADLGPVGGPVLGPFPTRAAALEAEVAWLADAMRDRDLTRRES